jgi:RNA polymerase primary sigma factor
MKLTREHERNAVDRYLDDIGREPLMTAEEEIRLGRIVQQSRELAQLERPLTKDEQRLMRRADKAKQRFIRANLRLVVYIAKKYQARTVFLDMLDLIQEASIGLMRSVEMFDPERGYKFSTYAYWWIRQAITRGINSQEYTIKRPTSVGEMAGRLTKISQQEMQRLNRTPTLSELAEAAEVKPSEIELLMQRGCACLSLDAPVQGCETSDLGDLVSDPNAPDSEESDIALDLAIKRDQLEAAMTRLTKQERDFLTRRYGLVDQKQWTYADLGREAGVSRERVRQITEKAIVKLRYQFGRTRTLAEIQATEEPVASTTAEAPVPRSTAHLVWKPRTGTTPSQALQCA